ncbi:MAG: hypothetical protein JW780_04185 [Clostridiales bacterium]|nr:hypothetical protein [Clostridiales bacterium]
MEVRVFRSPRRKMINPKCKEYGMITVVFALLCALLLFVFSRRFTPSILMVLYGVCFALIVLGVALVIRAAKEDPEYIHSFAITSEGRLYHVLAWIPGREDHFQSFPDNLSLPKILENQGPGYRDLVNFICSAEFSDCVRSLIRSESCRNPISQYISVRSICTLTVEHETTDYKLISYISDKGNRSTYARLYRRTDGYEQLNGLLADFSEEAPC